MINTFASYWFLICIFYFLDFRDLVHNLRVSKGQKIR